MLVRAILHASLLSVAACWVVPGSPPVDVRRRHRALPRTAAPVACAPFRSDADFDYFRRSKELTIELTKPLGAVLEALPDGGVQVVDIVEGGSASETGLLKKRDKLNDISGADVRWPPAAVWGGDERSLCARKLKTHTIRYGHNGGRSGLARH